MTFELPKLSYSYDALEQVIDAKTMETHHSKHHAGYTTNLNAALAKHPELSSRSIEDILKKLDDVPEDIKTAVINNGGGYANHNLYWEIMTPGGSIKPVGALADMINRTFDNFTNLKELLAKEALTRFGSGWAWLAVDANRDLELFSTPNQISPYSSGFTPILALDIWEHAYYLNYQNRRAEYIEKWLTIVNWDVISSKYDKL